MGHPNLRLIVERPSFSDYLRLAIDEIVHYGSRSLQVGRRVRALLHELLEVAPEFRRGDIERVLDALPEPPGVPGVELEHHAPHVH